MLQEFVSRDFLVAAKTTRTWYSHVEFLISVQRDNDSYKFVYVSLFVSHMF